MEKQAVKAKQCDQEIGVYWQAEFGLHAPTKKTPKYNREITPEHAAKIAKEHGFNTFEIMKTTEDIRRFVIEGGE